MPTLRSFALDIEPLRHHRDYRLIISGQVVNNFGTQVTRVALPYQVYVLTHSPLSLGILAASQLAAILAFSLIGGAIADAVDRRKLLLINQAGLCSVSAALFFLALVHTTVAWPLFLLAFIQATFGAIDAPARKAMIPRLVSRERLTAAMAINQAGFQTSTVVGPGLGGILIATIGLPAAFGFDVLSFVASFWTLLAIAKIPPLTQVARPSIATIVDGLRFIRKAPVVMAGFVIDLDAMVFGLPVALFPALALDFFHAGPAGLGLLVSAPAAGAIIGLLTSGWLQRTRHQGRVLIAMVAIWGASITLFGLVAFFPLALVFLAIAGGADALSAILRNSMSQMIATDEFRGRVSAAHSMVVSSGPRLGDIEATTVAALTSAQISVVSGGLVCLLGLLAVARAFPQLAAYDAFATNHLQFDSESGIAIADLAVVPVAADR